MPRRVLIAPDKFKGTLTAVAAARAIARGWQNVHPHDRLRLLPISDGGDGFGAILASLLDAKPQRVRSVDAAHRPCNVSWYWQPKSKTAVIESARVIGLAMLPPGGFHPFELDTFGLGAVIHAAIAKGARRIVVGIGGSATNDGGFGLARAFGWQFHDGAGEPITRWTDLDKLAEICPPSRNGRAGSPLPADGPEADDQPSLGSYGLTGGAHGVARPTSARMRLAGMRVPQIIVAVDVQNPLVGPRGATRIYGPQKGLQPADLTHAELCLRRLARVTGSGGLRPSHSKQSLQKLARTPGAGAGGGLGFGLLAFLGARVEPGFALFARHAGLMQKLRTADLVITGEGAIDHSTLMGKGTGQLARLCRQLKVPCIGLAGIVPQPRAAKTFFTGAHALVGLTTLELARAEPALWLERLASNVAASLP